MSKRYILLLSIGVIATLVIGFQVAASAVHDLGVFELEGNAVDEAAPGDDWNKVFAGTDSADETAFVQEPDKNASFFTGGGSKDPDNIPSWKWKHDVGGLPDKSNLTNSYAASYTHEATGDELLYFGADRFDGSGDAAIAFWFLQDEVAQTPASGSTGTFTGEHEPGDVLIISNFSGGGNVSTITVYEWDTSCTKADDNTPNDGECGAANLRIVTTSANADCATVGLNDDACAIVNNAADVNTAPWPFDNKDTDTDPNAEFLPGEFFEGGINLTDLELGGQCFASTVAETRTSTSPTSVLKDFTIGPFGDCEAATTTQASKADGNDEGTAPDPAGTVTPGTPVFDIATITGSGTTPLIDPTGTVQFFLCGPGQGAANPVTAAGCPTGAPVGTVTPPTPANSETVVGGTNTTDGISTATSEAVNTAAANLAPGRYCFRAVYSGDANYDGNGPAGVTNATTECFTVSQPTTVSTVQRWIPQDTATVTPASTDGVVSFQLYSDLVCGTGNEVGAPLTDNDADNDGVFRTNNTTITDDTTVSWRASFDPTGAEDPSTGVCESANVTFDNDITTP